MMTCNEVREEFSALLDGELSPEKRDSVEGHLAQCADCLRELDALRRVNTLFAQLDEKTAPEDFEARLQKSLTPSSVRFLRFSGLQRKALWPVLSAAVLFLVFGGYLVLIGSGALQRSRVASNLAKSDAVQSPQTLYRIEPTTAGESADSRKTAKSRAELFEESRQDLPAEGHVSDVVYQEADEEKLNLGAELQDLGQSEEPSGASQDTARRTVTVAGASEAQFDAAAESLPAAAPSATTEKDSVTQPPKRPVQRALPSVDHAFRPSAEPREMASVQEDVAPIPDRDMTASEADKGQESERSPYIYGNVEMAAPPAPDLEDSPTPETAPKMAVSAEPVSNLPEEGAAPVPMPQVASAPSHAPIARQTITVGERVIEKRDGYWAEKSYNGEEAESIRFNSDRARAFVAQWPNLDIPLGERSPVILLVDGKWLRIEPPETP